MNTLCEKYTYMNYLSAEIFASHNKQSIRGFVLHFKNTSALTSRSPSPPSKGHFLYYSLMSLPGLRHHLLSIDSRQLCPGLLTIVTVGF